jgi:hypothetical protein
VRARNICYHLAIVVMVVCAAPVYEAAQNYRLRGITPVFDGWEETADKGRLFYFGYVNRNGNETEIPIGPANSFDGGQADRGQPTSFLPGRHEHMFTIKVPATFTGKLSWTINSEMGAQAAHASFDQLYMLAQRENESADARPPEVEVTDVAARVGDPVTLTPRVTPAVSGGQVIVEAAAAEAAGLNVTWSKHRGPGHVTFAAAPNARAGGARGAGAAGGRGRGGQTPGIFPVACGSKPEAGCGEVTASFSAPGSYLLRVAARQDGMQGLGFLNVTVKP